MVMDGFDFSNIKFDLTSQMNMTQGIMADMENQHQAMIDSIAAANEERWKNEEEKKQSLRKIAENSEETVNSLKEANSILKENNLLLREKNEVLLKKLEEIGSAINILLDVTMESDENQEDMMKQALALAVQLNVAMEDNGKLNWKEVMANTSISSMILALQVFLHQRGLL